MPRLLFRKKAIDDINAIYRYTQKQWSLAQANHYYSIIQLGCLEIIKNPKIGKTYEMILSQVMGYRVGKHIIFYRINRDLDIEIIRILHGMMDLKGQIE